MRRSPKDINRSDLRMIGTLETDSTDLDELVRIDEACVAFEQGWSADAGLTAEALDQLVHRFEVTDREALLFEMLMVEWEARHAQGLEVDRLRYLGDWPDHSSVVSRAYSQLNRQRGLEPPSSSGGGYEELEAGYRVGPYTIQGKVGHGGMGDVYAALDTRLQRQVAIKVLAPHLTLNPSFVKRFAREAATVARLSHPNIVVLYDLGEAEMESGAAISFVVMELLEGESLRDQLAGEAISTARALQIAQEIAEALAAAHRKGIVHRDVKPENVFITEDGRVKVLDFGLARLTDDTQRASRLSEVATAQGTTLTREGTVLGTSGYMAPEQVRGGEATAASDIFALTCVLYEMLFDRKAFVGASVADAASATLRDDPLAVTAGPAKRLPTELVRLLKSGFDKDASTRPASATQFAAQLSQIRYRLDDVDPLAQHGRTHTSTGFPQKRSIWRAWALGINFATVLFIFGVYGLGWHRARILAPADSRPVAVLPFLSFQNQSDAKLLADSLTISLTDGLSRRSRLQVRPYSSIVAFDQSTNQDRSNYAPLRDRLNVDAVVTGHVETAGQEVTAHIELIDTVGDRLVWSEHYRRPASELLRLQEEILSDVVEHLDGESPEQDRQSDATTTQNLSAYSSFVRGQVAFTRRSQIDLRRAMEYNQQAIAEDPNFALAHAGIAQCSIVQAEREFVARETALQTGLDAIDRALELEPKLPDALVTRAMIRFEFLWQFDLAGQDFQRAIQQAPHSALARQWHAEYLSGTGRHAEALLEIRQARQLDPESPIIAAIVGRIYFKASDFDNARRELETVLRQHPDFERARGYLLEVCEAQDDYESALQHWRTLTDGSPAYMTLSTAFKNGGSAGYWRARLEQAEALNASHPIAKIFLAGVHARVGDPENLDAAFEILEQATYARAVALPANLQVHPAFARLRQDPRFARLVSMAFGPQ